MKNGAKHKNTDGNDAKHGNIDGNDKKHKNTDGNDAKHGIHMMEMMQNMRIIMEMM